MNYKREIERKFTVLSARFEDVTGRIEDFGGEVIEEYQTSTDCFWHQSGVDFVRLRKNTLELTVKVSDKGTVVDRIEENIVVKDYDTAKRFCILTFGDNYYELAKTFVVYSFRGAVLSVYTVEGSSQLFFEVEADTLELVDEVSEFFESEFSMRRESQSLFKIIFGDK